MQWIKCSERMPNTGMVVLFARPCVVHFGWLVTSGNYWRDESGSWVPLADVTHWQPLPEPPSEGS
jgi:hypothetical protein